MTSGCEMDTSSLMSGEGKQSAACEAPVKRPSSTLRGLHLAGCPPVSTVASKRADTELMRYRYHQLTSSTTPIAGIYRYIDDRTGTTPRKPST